MQKFIYTLLAFSVVLGGLLFAMDTNAMVVRWGESLTFEPYATTDDDLYLFGKKVSVQSTTTGDVIAAGRSVLQGGVTEQDSFLFGGVVNMEGTVNGDFRGAGGEVHIDGIVNEDVIVAGGMVVIGEDAEVNGDVLLFGEYISIEGTVHGTAKMYARTIELKGQIDGVVDAKADETLSVVGDAQLMSDLNYSAPREAFISDTVQIDGEIFFSEKVITPAEEEPFVDMATVTFVLITVAAALTILALFPKQAKHMTSTALREGTLIHGIYGFLLLLLIPMFAIVLFVTIIGMIPAVIVLLLYFVALALTFAVAPIVASVLLVRLLKKEEKAFDLSWVSLGAILFALLGLVPILGPLVRFIIFLLTFYAIFAVLYESIWLKRKDEMSPEVTQDATQENQHEQNQENGEEQKEG